MATQRKSSATANEIYLTNGKGKKAAKAVAASPVPTDVIPGDVVFTSVNGGKPQYYLVTQRWALWDGSQWRRPAALAPLSDQDMAKLPATRKRLLKANGWI
jgi:hypothetical protein